MGGNCRWCKKNGAAESRYMCIGERRLGRTKMKKTYRLLIIFTILFTNISCDQVSKKIVRQKIDYNAQIQVIENHFTLTRVENTGAFLSVGNSLSKPLKFILLSLLPLLAIVGGIFYLTIKSNVSKAAVISFCFVIGGGIGNIFDRIAYGSVTDFLYLKWGALHTGVFNLADISIMMGTGIILLFSFLKRT